MSSFSSTTTDITPQAQSQSQATSHHHTRHIQQHEHQHKLESNHSDKQTMYARTQAQTISILYKDALSSVFSYFTLTVAARVSAVNKHWNNVICSQPSLKAKYVVSDYRTRSVGWRSRFNNFTNSPIRHHVTRLIVDSFKESLSPSDLSVLSHAMPHLRELTMCLQSPSEHQEDFLQEPPHFPPRLSVLKIGCQSRPPSHCNFNSTILQVRNTLSSLSAIDTLTELRLLWRNKLMGRYPSETTTIPQILSSLRGLYRLHVLDLGNMGLKLHGILCDEDQDTIVSLPVLSNIDARFLFDRDILKLAMKDGLRQRIECMNTSQLVATSALLATLCTFPALTELYLAYCNFVEAAPLASLSKLRTIHLESINSEIEFNIDSLIAVMPSFTQLQHFNIQHSELTSDYLLRLIAPLKTLKSLYFCSYTKSITSLKFLSANHSLTNTLRTLRLPCEELFPLSDLQHIKNLHCLHSLEIRGSFVKRLDELQIQNLHDSLPHLKIIQ